MKMLLLAFLVVIIMMAILFTLPWLLINLVRRMRHRPSIRYRRFGYTTLGFSVFCILLIFYGYLFGRWRYEVKTWDFVDARIPASFDDYRVVHISDLHLEGFEDNPAHLDTLIKHINEQDADLICFTGDLVSFNHEGLLPFISKLRAMRAKDGIVSILGNHDYAVYDFGLDSLGSESDRKKLIDLVRDSLHWQLLLNEHTFIHRGNDSIAIVGSENQACGYGTRKKVHRGNLAQAMLGTEDCFQILLSHDPTHWDAEVVGKTHIPLTLSGHTHAMQIKVFDITPCSLLYKRSNGAYREGNQQLYVNIGLGQLAPFRIGATPEITTIRMKKQ